MDSDSSQWWHIIVITPFAVGIGAGLIGGGIGTLTAICFILTYPVAIFYDVKHLNRNGSNKNTTLWVISGILSLVTFGILSYIITPYYMLKR